MNEEIFISTRIRSRNQALLQNLLQVGCIINRIDHCVEQSLYVNCVPLHDIAVVNIGTGMCDVHTTSEKIAIKDMEDSTRFLFELLKA